MTAFLAAAALTLTAPPQDCSPVYGPDPDNDIKPHLFSEHVERVSLKDNEAEIFTFQDSSDCGLKNNAHPVVSDDGNLIAFSTRSQHVVEFRPNSNEISQVYLRNLAAGTTTLISEGLALQPVPGLMEVGNASSDFPQISGDGKYVVWSSGATNFIPNTQTGPQFVDVFIYDTTTGSMSRIEGPGGVAGNGRSIRPYVSGDGRFITFATRATNFGSDIGTFPYPPGGCTSVTPVGTRDNIFLYDQGDSGAGVSASLTWVSVGIAVGGCPENPTQQCSKPTVSANGCYVTFLSSSSNLTPEGNGANVDQVFMRDMTTGVTELVSHSDAGSFGNGVCRSAQISRDGNWVVFESESDNLLPPNQDINGLNDVFVWKRADGSIRRVSVDANGGEITSSIPMRPQVMNPHITGSGRFVFFTSWVDDFISNPAADFEIFLHDRDFNTDGVYDEAPAGVTTIRITDRPSSTTAGIDANQGSGGNCWASVDGKYFVFMGYPSDMVDASDVGGVDTNGDAEPNDATCCGGAGTPCTPNPGVTGRDCFRRVVWGTP